jgi:O-antigen/teichoic acid export membrane protein
VVSEKRKFIFDTGLVGFARVMENIFSYLIIVILTRFLGVEGLGQYSFIIAFVFIFFMLTNLGMDTIMVKDLSYDFSNAQKYINNVINFKLLTASISFIIYFATIFFIGKNEILVALILGGIWQFISSFNSIAYSIARVKQKPKVFIMGRITDRLIVLILGFAVLYFTKSLEYFFIALVLGAILEFIVISEQIINTIKYKFGIDWKFILQILKNGLPFFLIAIFTTICVKMDTIMLSFFDNETVVGLYNAPFKLIQTLNLIPSILLTFGFTHFSRLYFKNKIHFKIMFEKLLEAIIVIIMPIIVGIWFLGDRILKFVYNFNNFESFLVFQILIIGSSFIFLTTIMTNAITSANKQKTFAYIGGIGALINLILNFVLIPRYSLLGAGYATLVTYTVMFIIMYIYIYNKMVNFSFFKYLILPLFGSTIMGLLISQILHLNLFIVVAIGAVTYGVILLPFYSIREKVIFIKR